MLELDGDIFVRNMECVGAGISGGATMGPRGRGRALHPRGQVGDPPAVFLVPNILKYSRKKSYLNFRAFGKLFIFGVFSYCTNNQITDRKIFIFILFNINNRK